MNTGSPRISSIAGVAAPLLVDSISTDIISPSAVMSSPSKDFGKGLFHGWRYEADGSEKPDFVLNRPEFRSARILVAGKNFGCGSSREQASWCLLGFGIQCVIAPNFGEIFAENALKKGLLAVALAPEDVATLAEEVGRPSSNSREVVVDLKTCTVTFPSGIVRTFQISEYSRSLLLEGISELDLLLRESEAVGAHQAEARRRAPWIFDFDVGRVPAVQGAGG